MMTRTFTLTLIAAGLAVSQFPPPPPPAPAAPVVAAEAPEPPEPPLPPEPVLAYADASMARAHAALARTEAMMARGMGQGMPGMAPAMAGRSRLTDDEQMKVVAMETLMRNDPERAVAAIDKLLANPATTAAVRERAIGVLSRSDSPKAREIIVRTAKSSSNADLQRRAVHYLGMQKNNAALGEIYASATDVRVKREVLQSYLISGNREALVKLAKSESNADLRKHAIQLLGAMHGDAELTQLYATEQDASVRGAILTGLVASGNAKALIDVAKQEKSPELRRRAVQHLAMMNTKEAADFLSELLDK